jgi:hypothetical protein
MYETRDAKGVVIERKKGVNGESDADTAEKRLERSGTGQRHGEVGICGGASMSFSSGRTCSDTGFLFVPVRRWSQNQGIVSHSFFYFTG